MHIMDKKTQKQIADEAGITQGYLSKILSGQANPTIDILKKVSKASGIKLSSLINQDSST